MGWTSKMRESRYPNSFDRGGRYKGEIMFSRVEKTVSSDTENRRHVIEEIKERCNNGEKIDKIVEEIAARQNIKEQFDYYIKNGITDLTSIFKNWYQSYEKNKERNDKMKIVRW